MTDQGRQAASGADTPPLAARRRHHAASNSGACNHDEAIRWLNQAFARGSATLHLVNAELKFEPLRNDPRFKDLLQRMNLAQ